MSELVDTIAMPSPHRGPVERGREALERGDRDRALSCFERAVLNQPDNIRARLPLAGLLRELGRLAEAQAHYDHILAIQPTQVAALVGSAQLARQRGEPAVALDCLEKASAMDTGNLAIRLQMAQVLQALDRLDEAHALYQAIRDEDRSNPHAAAGLGYIARRRNENEAAAGLFREAMALGANNRDLLAVFTETLLDLGEDAEAKEIYSLAGAPDGKAGAKLLSRAARRLGLPDDARRHLEAAIARNPENSDLQLDLARLFRSQNRPDEAVPLYQAILGRDGRHLPALTELSAIFRNRGRAESAVPLLETAVTLDPGNSALELQLADALVASGCLEPAQRIYRRLLANTAMRARSHAGLGTIARLTRDPADAVEHFKAASVLDPRVPAYQLDLARTFAGLGNWVDAEKTYLRLLARVPDNLEALLQCGHIASKRGDIRAAAKFFADAARTAPADPRPARELRRLREIARCSENLA